MSEKRFPFSKEVIERLADTLPTPFHLYDEAAILENARYIKKAFAWAPGFKNYFAVKACPNPTILDLLHKEGFGTDCSSLPELILSEKSGISGEEVMFTSNDTPAEEFKEAKRLGAIINLDDISHIDFLEKTAGIPELICFRYNPGDSRSGNVIIGEPKEAKYGLTRDQILDAYRMAKEKGARRFGLHTMVASNELNPEYFIETGRMLFELAVKIKEELGIKLEFINLGGGIGIPYRLDQEPVDLVRVSEGIRGWYDKMIVPAGLDPLKIVMECGRVVTGPYGYLISRVRHVAKKYKTYVGLDASMANLMRPAIYGAYHHITVLGKENEPSAMVCDVTGSLCENNDKFAIDRKLPEIEVGDLVAIHDAGAHGYAMGFNYNGKLRSAEVLIKDPETVELIRRAETMDDLFATLRFPGAPVKV
ncbi:diaminopimelate decarboxylase family protein [Sediminispirochaeta bajacaliforniensis]|uniref:diaminopimelate decarboxylase family protein n=1 Tax=Sediminispirochaeta bajacaliforniensis TaxID=148 RepID=UPI00036A973D|nr:diaminopimelate decarboxylase [Sediminispirochaeta bajacaliforniensis]